MGTWFKWGSLIALLILAFQNCGELSSSQTVSQLSELTQEWSDRFLQTSVDDAQEKALLIKQRTGIKVSLDDPQIAEMAQLIENGDALAAARLAVESPEFLNLVIRDFAAPMSNREEKVNVELNDFIATIIGIARDNRDAREMLTGNEIYWAPGAATKSNYRNHVLRTSQHYQELEQNFVDLAENLEPVEQQVLTVANSVEEFPDAAGVITSRAFMSAHAAGGTNRRLVEFSFSQFLCSPIETWAGGGLGGGFIGRDVGRKPIETFKNKCSRCHGPMDSMRPAFAHVNFRDGFFQYKELYQFDPRANNAAVVDVPVPEAEQLVPSKFRRGKDIFSNGHVVEEDSWYNFTSPNFGWRSETSGSGIKAFGEMLANSRQFSRCMSKRAFKTLCYRDVGPEEQELLETWADHFENSQYSLKELFARVVSDSSCLGGRQ